MNETNPHVVAVLNQKGGVGKTTVTLGLASAAASAARRVLVIDLDPQGASTWVLGLDPAAATPSIGDVIDGGASVLDARVESPWSARFGLPGTVDLVPATNELQDHEDGAADRLARALRDVGPAGEYDAVLIDCPPSLGSLTTNALVAARHALVVVEPSALGLRGIGGVADVVDQVWDRHNPDLDLGGVIVNRVPTVSSEADRRIDELARIVGRDTIWTPPIPQRVVLNEAIGARRPVHSYGVRGLDPIVVFDALWTRLRRLVSR